MCFVDTAVGESNAAVNGDEVLSASVSASVLDTHSVTATDVQADNRISEMVDNNASEKCNSSATYLLTYLFICAVEYSSNTRR